MNTMSPYAEFKCDVFLGHNAKDKVRVRRLADRLRAAKLRVWFDEWAIKAGDNIPAKIEEGLKNTRACSNVPPDCLREGGCSAYHVMRSARTGPFALAALSTINLQPSTKPRPLNNERRFIPL